MSRDVETDQTVAVKKVKELSADRLRPDANRKRSLHTDQIGFERGGQRWHQPNGVKRNQAASGIASQEYHCPARCVRRQIGSVAGVRVHGDRFGDRHTRHEYRDHTGPHQIVYSDDAGGSGVSAHELDSASGKFEAEICFVGFILFCFLTEISPSAHHTGFETE